MIMTQRLIMRAMWTSSVVPMLRWSAGTISYTGTTAAFLLSPRFRFVVRLNPMETRAGVRGSSGGPLPFNPLNRSNGEYEIRQRLWQRDGNRGGR
jgi:hypothetical protein